MNWFKRVGALTAMVMLLSSVEKTLAHGIEIGRTSGNALTAAFETIDPDMAQFLPPVSGLLNGWSNNEPGFAAVEANDPGENIYQLAAGANISLEVVAITPAFNVWTTGFASLLDSAGDTWTLGGNMLTGHPTWLINSDSPSFDPGETTWTFAFRLVDHGSTNYSPSPTYTLSFTNVENVAMVPTVSEWGLVNMALLLLAGGMIRFRGSATLKRST